MSMTQIPGSAPRSSPARMALATAPPPRHRRPRTAGESAEILADRFLGALRAGDGAAAEDVVAEALDLRISPAAIQAQVITPAMVRIGELWERAVITVADEHVASSISQRALVRIFEVMRTRVPSPPRGRVLLAAVEGQQHVLGLRMVADVLECSGYDVLYLGEDVPVASLREFIALHRPAVVGLTFGVAMGVEHLGSALAAIHETMPEPRIMLGGRAIPPALWDAGYPRVTSSLEVVETVEALLAGPPAPRADLSRMRAPQVERARPGDSDAAATRLAKIADDGMELAREQIRRAVAYRDLALQDELTQLFNRRGLEEQIRSLTQSSDVHGAMLMIDVDEFKLINDRYGHAAGDRTLQAVGQAIAGSLRPQDLAARMGGDEFAVLIPGASIEGGRRVAERIRAAVAAVLAGYPATVSIGVASVGGDVRSLLLAADTALYAAKAAGRDCVVTQASTFAEAA